MNVRIPSHRTCYMRPLRKPDKQQARRHSLTVNELNALIVTPDCLPRPRPESSPLEHVVRIVEPDQQEGGDEK